MSDAHSDGMGTPFERAIAEARWIQPDVNKWIFVAWIFKHEKHGVIGVTTSPYAKTGMTIPEKDVVAYGIEDPEFHIYKGYLEKAATKVRLTAQRGPYRGKNE